MNHKLYIQLINNISESVKLSLNEMAKKIDNRNIDRKLWLSVASVCSRNKSTNCEFVKPMKKLTKEDLLNRYVAALLIMKKQCPKSEKDIETLKTFKLFGLKALLLGATLQDIQNLYNVNAGIKSNNTVTTPVKNQPVKNNKLFTDQEAEELGDDTLEAISKIMEHPLDKQLDSLLQELHDTIFKYDVTKFALTINKILDLFDETKTNKKNRLWSFYVGYEPTYSPKVERTRYELVYFDDENGKFSYEHSEKVLNPGENMFNAMDRAKHWRQGYSFYDRYDCYSRFVLSIFSFNNDGDEMNTSIKGNTGPNAKQELYDKLAEHFKKAFTKLEEILDARTHFDSKKYMFDRKPLYYVDWVAYYMPIILKNNGYTNKSFYDGISIRNVGASFWSGSLKTCTPDGIIYWVGGDSTDDEGKISYSEWKSRREFYEHSSYAGASISLDFDDKEEVSKKIYNYMLELMKDGKLK